jgi:hypothetical protein
MCTFPKQNIPVIEIRLKRIEAMNCWNVTEMAGNPDSKDKSLEALDFIINVLKEHEQTLDKAISELANITKQIGNTDKLDDKMEKIEEKIGNLQKELKNYVGNKSSVLKPFGDKKQELPVQETSVVSNTMSQNDVSLILTCKHWIDFQTSATRAQTLTFNIKETEKIFQVDAIRGSQIIRFTGFLPNFSVIFKTWLCRQLDSPEQNILEGFLDTPK